MLSLLHVLNRPYYEYESYYILMTKEEKRKQIRQQIVKAVVFLPCPLTISKENKSKYLHFLTKLTLLQVYNTAN